MDAKAAAEQVVDMDPAVPGVARLWKELLSLAYDLPLSDEHIVLVRRPLKNKERWG